MTTGRYMLVEMKTGAMDGWYKNKADAEGVRGRLTEEYPLSEWCLVQNQSPDDEFFRIYDHRFHANNKQALREIFPKPETTA